MVMILQPIRVIKAAVRDGQRCAVHVPFATVIGAVAQWMQVRGKQSRPLGTLSACSTAQAGQRIAVNLLRIVTSEQRGS